MLLGKPNRELTWNTWRNPRNVYINFNDSNKSMMISGVYEYSFRNFYITYILIDKYRSYEDYSWITIRKVLDFYAGDEKEWV